MGKLRVVVRQLVVEMDGKGRWVGGFMLPRLGFISFIYLFVYSLRVWFSSEGGKGDVMRYINLQTGLIEMGFNVRIRSAERQFASCLCTCLEVLVRLILNTNWITDRVHCVPSIYL